MTRQTQAQTIESLDLPLSKVFNDFYVVPSYQREYVWETQQVEQLLLDIHDAFPDDGQMMSEYFIGSLVVCPGDEGLLDLIDGQQRMTTAYVFLCAVRDYIEELGADPLQPLDQQIAAIQMDDYGNQVSRYRVSLQYEDSRNVLERIADGAEDISEMAQDTRSVENILNAYHVIRAFLKREFEGNVAEIRRFYAYFINRVKLVRIKTQSVAHALKVFETINDRGVGLDSMDLLKNLMFMQAERAGFENLKEKWKTLVDVLHRAKEKPLRFLRYYVFATYNVTRLRQDEIYQWFADNEELCGYGSDPLNFVDKLNAAARAYTNFVDGKNIDRSPNRYLINLSYLSGAARQQLILLLAGRHLSVTLFTELARHIENLFFAYIIAREPTKEFERAFARWAPELRTVEDRAELNAFVQDHFVPAKQELATRFELAFVELNEEAIQKYRMRYILGKMTQYVNEDAYGQTPLDLGQYVKRKDVEHILPQNPSSSIKANFDKPDRIQEYTQRLGNMTMLEHSINRSIGNKPFSEKKKAYANSQFLLTKSIAEEIKIGKNTKIDRAVSQLTTFDKWSSESIERRQEMLTDLAKRVWDMPEGD